MQAPLFYRPWTITGSIDAFGNLDRAILMPAERPIARVALVEQQRPYRPRGGTDQVPDIVVDGAAGAQAGRVSRCDPQTRAIGRHGVEQPLQFGERRSVEPSGP